MAEEVNQEGADARRLRSRNGVPRISLESIEASVKAIWVAARRTEAAPVTIARAITGKSDAKASGGAWNKRIAALRGYNVIERSSYKLTEIGLAIANTADLEMRARGLRDAVLSVPAYRKFLERANGEELPALALLASEIEFEYELSNTDALSAARVFVESVTYAGLVDESGKVSLAGMVVTPLPDEGGREESEAPMLEPAVGEANVSPTPGARIAPAPSATPEVVTREATPHVTLAVPAGVSAPVSIKVRIDMTEWAADDAVKVLKVLGYREDVSESD